MLRAAIKSLLGHKLRLFTTAAAVLLGVSFMTASFVLTDTIKHSFNSLFADAYKNLDVVVRAKTAFRTDRGGPGSTGVPIPGALVRTVQSVPGVKAAEGYVFSGAILAQKDGKVPGGPRGFVAGLSWPATPDFNSFELVVGRPPKGSDEVVLAKATAEDRKLAIGDRTTLVVANPSGADAQGGRSTLRIRVVGVATFNGSSSFGGLGFVAMDPTDASQNFLAPGLVQDIFIRADPGVSPEQLVSRVRPRLPADVEVVTGAAFTGQQQKELQDQLQVVTTIFVGFATLSLLVGVFLIYNTFSVIVTQRTRELALLRAIGASRRQVLSSVLVESLAVGAVASVLGLAAGIGLAVGLKAVFKAAGASLPEGATIVAPRTIVLSILVGLVVTMVSAILPALRASKVAPVAAMRETAVDESSASRGRRISGVVLVVLGALTLIRGAFGSSPSQAGIGGALVLVALIVLGPVIVPPVGRLIGSVLVRFGITGRLARENAIRSPRRTASTATSLMISLTLVGTLLILVSSFVGTINATFEQRFHGNFALSGSNGFNSSNIGRGLAARLAKLPEVGAVSGVRTDQAKLFDSVTDVVFVDPATIDRIVDTGTKQGSLSRLGPTALAVNTKTAAAHRLRVGSQVPVTFASGAQATLTVQAVYENASTITQNDDPYLLGIPAAQRFLPPTVGDVRILVKNAPGVSEAQARTAIERVTKADFPQVKVRNKEQVKSEAAKQFNQFLTFFLILLGLSVIIGLLGIVNTMLLSIFERTRELGLLRAVGMKRRQLGAAISMESVIIALLGTTLGMVVGVGLGAAVILSVRDQIAGAKVVLPYGQLVMVFVITVIVGVLAAVWPARRAIKLDVLDAIGTE